MRDKSPAYPPLYLSRAEAARYVGVGESLFDAEVAAGIWPPPTRRGSKGGRVTWYRPALERAAAEREETGSTTGDFERWRAGGFAASRSPPKPPRRRR